MLIFEQSVSLPEASASQSPGDISGRVAAGVSVGSSPFRWATTNLRTEKVLKAIFFFMGNGPKNENDIKIYI